jgi:hypothetical protein
MATRFGSFLKGKRPSAGASGVPTDPLSSLAAQSIELNQDAVEENDILDWDRLEEETPLLRVGLIEGLREGVPKVAAARLYEVAPSLFKAAPEPGAVIALRLHPIVNQLANLLPEAPEPAEILNQSFETPFSRQAEEERARLLQKPNRLPVPGTSESISHSPDRETAPEEPQYEPSDRPSTPIELLRERQFAPAPAPREEAIPSEAGKPGSGAKLNEVPEPPCLPVATRSPAKPENPPPVVHVATRVSDCPAALNRRAAMERLQELLFMEEDLDAARVAEELLKLPKIHGVLVIRGRAVLGGMLPKEYDPEVALSAPEVIESLERFTAALGDTQFSSATISATQQITLVSQGDITLVIVHQGRFVPGVREKLVETARALHDLYRSFGP